MFGNSKSLKEELASKDVVILQLQTELDDYRKSMTSFSKQKFAYEEEKTKLVSKYEGTITNLKQEIEFEKKSVARRVNSELASIGVNQFLPEEISMEQNDSSSPESILQQFTSMPENSAKHEFFKKHEAVISKAMKEKKQ
jgi:hypothetical protein